MDLKRSMRCGRILSFLQREAFKPAWADCDCEHDLVLRGETELRLSRQQIDENLV